MFVNRYDATVTKDQVFDHDRVWLWVRHKRGEPGHADVTLCGTNSDGIATFTVNQEDVDNSVEPDTGLRGIPLTGEAARRLMDDMWRVGVRPSTDEGNVGALEATRDHLKDMKSIAMRLFEKVLERGNDGQQTDRERQV